MVIGAFDRLRGGLRRTREVLGRGLERLRTARGAEREHALEELEQRLIEADVGVEAAGTIRDRLEEYLRTSPGPSWEELMGVIREQLLDLMRVPVSPPLVEPEEHVSPYVILFAGVNGSGKTTSLGKLAYHYAKEGHRVMVGAADTFRAAAVEQLAIWTQRAGADLVAQKPGADPASVAFDAVTAAKARGHSVVLLDTAGRQHTKVNLMNELAKIRRVVNKAHSGAPHESLLVLDATVGQNAVSQARIFHEVLELDGIFLAKVDGTAKGGVVVPVIRELGLPVRWLGVGEGIDDIEPFSPERFVEAMLAPQ